MFYNAMTSNTPCSLPVSKDSSLTAWYNFPSGSTSLPAQASHRFSSQEFIVILIPSKLWGKKILNVKDAFLKNYSALAYSP